MLFVYRLVSINQKIKIKIKLIGKPIVDNDRDRILEYLGDHGIQAYIGYVPLHSSSFAINNQLNQVLENTDYVSERVIRLHIHTNLSIDDIKYVCKKLNDFYYKSS